MVDIILDFLEMGLVPQTLRNPEMKNIIGDLVYEEG